MKNTGVPKKPRQKALHTVAVHITIDSCLLKQLQRDLPNVVTKILSQLQAQLYHVRSY